MRLVTAVRWNGAYWFVPALFAGSCVVGASDTFRTGYATNDIASASYALYIAGPLTAAYVAARFRGFPRFVRPLRSARSGLLVVFGAWWALLIGAPVFVCLAALWTARAIPDDLGSWSLVLIDFMTVLTCALVGLAFSWALPVVVAVPSVTVLWFVWLAYGPSTDNELLHNLVSTFAACCDSSMMPASVAVRATLTLTGVICAGIVLLLASGQWARRSRLVVAPAVAGVLIAGLGAGAAVATASSRQLTLQAVEPRTSALKCQVHDSVRACLWPETVDRAGELSRIVSALNENLALLGIAPITDLTQAGRDKGAVSVEAGDQLDDDDLRYALAVAYVDQQAGCVVTRQRSSDERIALIALATGLASTELAGRFDSTVVAAAEAQLSQGRTSPDDVRAWFADGIDSARCSTG